MVSNTGAPKPQKLTLTTREVAELLGVHPLTMKRWIASGKVPSKKLGAKRFISRQWVDDFMAGMLEGSTDDRA